MTSAAQPTRCACHGARSHHLGETHIQRCTVGKRRENATTYFSSKYSFSAELYKKAIDLHLASLEYFFYSGLYFRIVGLRNDHASRKQYFGFMYIINIQSFQVKSASYFLGHACFSLISGHRHGHRHGHCALEKATPHPMNLQKRTRRSLSPAPGGSM